MGIDEPWLKRVKVEKIVKQQKKNFLGNRKHVTKGACQGQEREVLEEGINDL